MSKCPFIILTVILGLLSPLASADHSKRVIQIPAQWPQAQPVYPRVMPVEQPTSQPSSTDSVNAALPNPVPPPSPTSPTTFKNGVVVPISGTAAGIGFQNFL